MRDELPCDFSTQMQKSTSDEREKRKNIKFSFFLFINNKLVNDFHNIAETEENCRGNFMKLSIDFVAGTIKNIQHNLHISFLTYLIFFHNKLFFSFFFFLVLMKIYASYSSQIFLRILHFSSNALAFSAKCDSPFEIKI